ncbi:hypothetical protein IAR55_004052 [Kwoniella newhampshirensis]|uniref:SWIM-type domain-containing protein n=1 Tax=Kwoniella newhampshirensis TaxID=1651941 RepID=A0AAW0YYD1_9TREE
MTSYPIPLGVASQIINPRPAGDLLISIVMRNLQFPCQQLTSALNSVTRRRTPTQTMILFRKQVKLIVYQVLLLLRRFSIHLYLMKTPSLMIPISITILIRPLLMTLIVPRVALRPTLPKAFALQKPVVASTSHSGYTWQSTPGANRSTGFIKQRRTVETGNDYFDEIHNIAELPNYMDALPCQPHDYGWYSEPRISSYLTVNWLDPPGLKPKDIRGRHMSVHVDSQAVRKNPKGCIFRVTYKCTGSCKRTKDPNNTDVFSTVYEELEHQTKQAKERALSSLTKKFLAIAENGTSPGVQAGKRGRPRKSLCNSLLVISISAEQAQQGLFTARRQTEDAHPHGPKSLLAISLFIRQVLHERAATLGMTQLRLKNWYEGSYQTSPYGQWIRDRHPHRGPSEHNYKTAVETALRKSRLDCDPLSAIPILADSNPDAMIAFVIPEEDEDEEMSTENDVSNTTGIEDSVPQTASQSASLPRYQCIIAPPHALDTAILYSLDHGAFMDSSWRNKVQSRCPATIVSTINEYHRMVPIAFMVSRHADTETYQYMLEQIAIAVQDRASSLLEENANTHYQDRQRDRLLDKCGHIVDFGFRPRYMMIDGDDAERSAIQMVFPTFPFACVNFISYRLVVRKRSFFGTNKEGQNRCERFLAAFRQVQRCPTEADWDRYFERFRQEVLFIVRNDAPTWASIERYLNRTWFSLRWRSHCIDYGIPSDLTRDGGCSTNNFAEAAFRTFDRIFLSARVNKRLDRLLIIIIHTYFPFYKYNPPNHPRAHKKLLNVLADGWRIWQSNEIRRLPGDRTNSRMAFEFKFEGSDQSTCGRRAMNGDQQGREVCSCDMWTQTGKRCPHLWAMSIFLDFGSVCDYEGRAVNIAETCEAEAHQYAVQSRQRPFTFPNGSEADANDTTMPAEDDDELLPTSFMDLASWDQDSASPVSPSSRRSVLGKRTHPKDSPGERSKTGAGRPAKMKPLHQYRSKSTQHLSKRAAKHNANQRLSTSRPSGSINTGADCYALSLFHMLCRLDAFASLVRSLTVDSSMVQLLLDFLGDISARRTERYPLLQQCLIDNKLIEPHDSGQQDPVELLYRLFQFFDTRSSQVSLSSLFQYKTAAATVCSLCSAGGQLRNTRQSETVLTVYPEQLRYQAVSFDVSDLIATALRRENPIQSFCRSCCRSSHSITNDRFTSMGSMFAINIVWSIENFDNGPPQLKRLCKVGCTALDGHYAAAIQEGGNWWMIDNDQVTPVRNLQAFFEKGRLPVLLVYTVTTGDDRSPPSMLQPTQSRALAVEVSQTAQTKLSEEERYFMVMERYRNVRWSDPTVVEPLVSALSTETRLYSDHLENFCAILKRDPPLPGINKKNVDCGSGVKIRRETLYDRFAHPTAWWTSTICEIIGTIAKNMIETRDADPPTTGLEVIESFCGTDGTWRTKRQCGVVYPDGSHHFFTMAVFGPDKLVVTYDGAGGLYGSGFIEKFRERLRSRLKWELEAGIASEADCCGWLVSPNNPGMRDRIGWIAQEDTFSCGSLASAAMVLLCQGIKPSAEALLQVSGRAESRKITPSDRQCLDLRHSMLGLFLSWAGANVRSDSRDHWTKHDAVECLIRQIMPYRERLDYA